MGVLAFVSKELQNDPKIVLARKSFVHQSLDVAPVKIKNEDSSSSEYVSKEFNKKRKELKAICAQVTLSREIPPLLQKKAKEFEKFYQRLERPRKYEEITDFLQLKIKPKVAEIKSLIQKSLKPEKKKKKKS